VVLITLDTTRADHLGAYGYSRPTSPFIDDLARTGLRFTNHFTPMPTTEPAHATMLTGLYPRSHGILANGTRAALPNLPTLGTWFQRREYRTAALLSRYGLAPEKLGLAGFDEQWEPGAVPAESAAPATYGRFREFLRANESRPFFLWLHFWDPHDPYRPPGTFDVFAPGNREPEATS
jgi:arylsulfatase A-like enzyme